MTRKERTAVEQVEWVRNLLAFLLVGSFVAFGGAMFAFVIPEQNKDILTYMVGQLSGMALTVLGFFFMDKVGQAAIDAKKSENTGLLAEAVTTALKTGSQPDADAIHPGDTVTLATPDTPDGEAR